MERNQAPPRSAPASGARKLTPPSGGALAVFFIAAVLALAADLVSKHVVFRDFLQTQGLPRQIQALKAGSSRPLSPQVVLRALDLHKPLGAGLRLTASVNPGVVFGWSLPRPLVLLASVAMIGIVAVMLLHTQPGAHAQRVAIALVLAGAMGNLYDRLFSNVQLPGLEPIRYHVRDFIDASALHYPYVFNIADIWLVVGVAFLLVRSLIPHRDKAKAS